MDELFRKKIDEHIHVSLSGVVFLDAVRLMSSIDLRMTPEQAHELARRIHRAASSAEFQLEQIKERDARLAQQNQ